jgi:hypothetical protein
MKPLAKLYLNRQRLYEKTCDTAGDAPDSGMMNSNGRKMKKEENAFRFICRVGYGVHGRIDRMISDYSFSRVHRAWRFSRSKEE